MTLRQDGLSPEAEALLTHERSPATVPAALRSRALARAQGAGLRAGRTSWSTAGSAKWLLAAAVLGAGTLAMAATHLWSHAGSPPYPQDGRALATNAPTDAPSANSPTPNPAVGVVAAENNAGAAENSVSPRPSSPRAPERRNSTRSRKATTAEDFALELQLLQPARDAIAQGNFAAALPALIAHDRRFATGHLAEEREALRVQALAGLRRTDEARRAALAFHQRFPHSVLWARINSAAE